MTSIQASSRPYSEPVLFNLKTALAELNETVVYHSAESSFDEGGLHNYTDNNRIHLCPKYS